MQLFVCAPFFFFFFSSFLMPPPCGEGPNLTTRLGTLLKYSWCELGCRCARIDNNRREYCVRWAAQLCVHACVLRFFFLFISQIYVNILFTWIMITSQLLKLLRRRKHNPLSFNNFFLFFSLCENRQQPTWILRSLSCTVVQLFVCASFFFLLCVSTFSFIIFCKKNMLTPLLLLFTDDNILL